MILISVLFLSIGVYSHSWLHCVDYDKTASLSVGRINSRYCRALARGIPSDTLFGEDRGYNYQPENGVACRNKFSGNIVRMRTGSSYRFLWPAKNHVSSSCTNPYISDISLRLYLYPVDDFTSSDPSFTRWTSSSYLFYDFKRSGKGFQNCPDVCPETDRVPCFGDVSIPLNQDPGYYKAIWVWNFNPNEFFTHCLDIEITPTVQPTITPTVQPTITPTVQPTRTPTVQPTRTPTVQPTRTPTVQPTRTPTVQPTRTPTVQPTRTPTLQPTRTPTVQPTRTPTLQPTRTPTLQPTRTPTLQPTRTPTLQPTRTPTLQPTRTPTLQPTRTPTLQPTRTPTLQPTRTPTLQPTRTPTLQPTRTPTLQPTRTPTLQPTRTPTLQPNY
jgi:hypothetical protein